MFSRFFINRPIFASVLSIVITLGGFVSVFTLPIAQYPEIAPPTVEVSASYPGANAQVVADTVAAPIEQQVNGVEGMMYMSSQSTNDGSSTSLPRSAGSKTLTSLATSFSKASAARSFI
jgi:multidrug efflux pump subunit AcrB